MNTDKKGERENAMGKQLLNPYSQTLFEKHGSKLCFESSSHFANRRETEFSEISSKLYLETRVKLRDFKMLQIPHYFRKQNFIYSLQSHPEYWFYTGRSKNQQIIFGLIEGDVCVLRFSCEGELLGVPETIHSVKNIFPQNNEVDLDFLSEHLDKFAQQYRLKNKFNDQSIGIKRFRFPELKVGIEDLPDDIQEYILQPERFSPDDRIEFEDTLQGWKEESLFVFWWRQSFTVNEEGVVTTS